MSRQVQRVSLDFDWPIDKVWDGYLLPERMREQTCAECAGQGVTTARQWVGASAHMILLLAGDLRAQAQGKPMHPYFAEYYTSAHGTRPSSDITELTAGLAGRESDWFGHDSLDGYEAANKIIKAAGLDPDTWGWCPNCGGHGSTEKYDGQRAEAEAWEPTDPPTGEGWQMWETTSEGSPKTPVFATPDDLADYCANHVAVFGYTMTTHDRWLAIIHGDDFAHVEIAPGVIIL